MAVQHPDDPAATVVLHSVGASSKYRPRLDQLGLRMEVQIKAQFRVEETTLPLDLTDMDTVSYLEQAVCEAILDEARQTLQRVQQEYRSDIYGFGAEIHRRYPRHWREIVEDWPELFPELEVDIQAKANVRTGGLTIRGM